MNNGSVYLIGGISGMSYDACTNWREEAKKVLNDVGIAVFSPMRGKHHLSNQDNIATHIKNHKYYNNDTIVSFDYFDVSRASVGFANFTGAPRVSIGSLFELAWFFEKRKPVVAIFDEHGYHDHPFVHAACPFIAQNLYDGIEIIKRLLLP